ncbi:MAG: hypothetical protein AAGD07_01130 [Planctomycetota bacterium]
MSRRNLVELRLKRIRQEASAARLEAQAVALELLLQRMDAGESITQEEWDRVGIEAPGGQHPFTSWDDVRQAMQRATNNLAEGGVSVTDELEDRAAPNPVTPVLRFDPGHASPAKPTMLRDVTRATAPGQATASVQDDIDVTDAPDNDDEQSAEVLAEMASYEDMVAFEVDDDEEIGPERRKPMAMVISAAVHLLILFLLAAFTLSSHEPKDQIAISATAVSNDEPQMESFVLESQEPVMEPNTEPTEPTEVDISPLGEVAAMEMPTTPDAVTGPPLPAMSSLASASSSAMKALSSTSDQSMEFCGVEGGGNHFVYLVDSSGSMGDAFVSARNALFQSIQMLSDKQRFYVVFFDAESDYMRISDPSVDESGSVNATLENKQRLKNWAMGISMDRGLAPYDALRFALKLRPDVIFLLSDGEFPPDIEVLLQEENRISNLFGDDDPISIIHTISYHSREGESRMRRIAQAHRGQYRHVPKP